MRRQRKERKGKTFAFQGSSGLFHLSACFSGLLSTSLLSSHSVLLLVLSFLPSTPAFCCKEANSQPTKMCSSRTFPTRPPCVPLIPLQHPVRQVLHLEYPGQGLMLCARFRYKACARERLLSRLSAVPIVCSMVRNHWAASSSASPWPSSLLLVELCACLYLSINVDSVCF